MALLALCVGVYAGAAVSTAGWKTVSMSTEEERVAIPFTVALKPSNLARVDALLEAVSVRAMNATPTRCPGLHATCLFLVPR